MNTNDTPAVAARHPWRTVTILLIGCFVSLVNETMLNVALTTMQSELGISAGVAQWLTVGYILTVAIMIPVTGFLIHTCTTKTLFSSGMALLLVGSIMAGFTHTFPLLMVSRVIQALGAGMSVSISINTGLALIRPSQHGFVNALTAGTATLGPALGPVYAGVLLRYTSSQGLFRVMIIPAALLLLASLLFVENASDLTKPKLDALSVVLSSVGFFLLIYGISNLGGAVLPCLLPIVLGLAVLFVWARRQLGLKQPFLNIRTLKQPGFPTVSILLAVSNLAMLSGSVLVPMLLQQGHNYTVFLSSVVMLPASLMMSICAPISGKIFDRSGAKTVSIVGTLCINVGLLALALGSPTLPVVCYVIFCMFMFAGISLIQSPLQSHIYARIDPANRSDAVAISSMSMQIGGSTGTALSVCLFTRFTALNAGDAWGGIFRGFSLTFLVLGILCIAATVLVIRLFRARSAA